MAKLVAFFVIISALQGLVTSLNEDSVKEKKCFPVESSNVELDYSWVMSNSEWYFPLMSKLELYRTAQDTFKKEMKDLSSSVVEGEGQACVKAEWSGFMPTLQAFGKTVDYDLSPGLDNVFTFESSWRKSSNGKMQVTKTDNKNWILFIKCWEDNEVSWVVMSQNEVLKKEEKEEIFKTIASFGLNKDLAFEITFDKCDDNKRKSSVEL